MNKQQQKIAKYVGFFALLLIVITFLMYFVYLVYITHFSTKSKSSSMTNSPSSTPPASYSEEPPTSSQPEPVSSEEPPTSSQPEPVSSSEPPSSNPPNSQPAPVCFLNCLENSVINKMIESVKPESDFFYEIRKVDDKNCNVKYIESSDTTQKKRITFESDDSCDWNIVGISTL